MLILSRKAGEVVHIGDKIKVSIMKLAGGRVRLGIEAPEDVRILRGELDGWLATSLDESNRCPSMGDLARN